MGGDGAHQGVGAERALETVLGGKPGPQDTEEATMTPEQMQTFMERVITLEAEMDASGTFVFGGALHGPDAATVVRVSDADVVPLSGDKCMAGNQEVVVEPSQAQLAGTLAAVFGDQQRPAVIGRFTAARCI